MMFGCKPYMVFQICHVLPATGQPSSSDACPHQGTALFLQKEYFDPQGPSEDVVGSCVNASHGQL